MTWTLAVVGKPKLAYARAGVAEYVKRLGSVVRVEFVHVAASDRAREGAALLQRTEGMYRVALDEQGEEVSSREFAARVTQWEMDRVKGIALLVGGADGHGDAVRAAVDWTWSLGRLTLQHELALVVVMEQLYRAYSIKAGAPYHRD